MNSLDEAQNSGRSEYPRRTDARAHSDRCSGSRRAAHLRISVINSPGWSTFSLTRPSFGRTKNEFMGIRRLPRRSAMLTLASTANQRRRGVPRVYDVTLASVEGAVVLALRRPILLCDGGEHLTASTALLGTEDAGTGKLILCGSLHPHRRCCNSFYLRAEYNYRQGGRTFVGYP